MAEYTPEEIRELLPRGVIAIIVLLLLLFAGQAGIYSINPESKGVVTRFGKFVKETDSGLHVMIPFVDRVQMVEVKRQKKQEFGFGTPQNTNRSQYSGSNEALLEKTIVTGDLNSSEVEWIIQYRIDKPGEFLFNVRDPEQTLRHVSESVMREVVGDRTVDEVLTIGRQEIEASALAGMQEVVNKYRMGLRIDQVQLKNVNPPPQVRASFDEVNEAQQEREQMINVANGEYNKVVPRAKGEADQKIQEAEGYALQRVNEAMGDVTRFNALYTEYQAAPEITKRRFYLETIRSVLPRVQSKVIIDADLVDGAVPLLPLNELWKGGAN